MSNFWKVIILAGILGIGFIWYRLENIKINASYTTNAKTERIIQQIAGKDKLQTIYKEKSLIDSTASEYLLRTADDLQRQMVEIRKQNDLLKERTACDTVIYTLREVVKEKDSAYYNLNIAYMVRGEMLDQKDTLIKISNDELGELQQELSGTKNKLRRTRKIAGVLAGVSLIEGAALILK